jgi:hypothetical protein
MQIRLACWSLAITPDQVEEIITRVVDEVDEREQRSGPHNGQP